MQIFFTSFEGGVGGGEVVCLSLIWKNRVYRDGQIDHISKTKNRNNRKIDFSFVSKHYASIRIIKLKRPCLRGGGSADRYLGQGPFVSKRFSPNWTKKSKQLF